MNETNTLKDTTKTQEEIGNLYYPMFSKEIEFIIKIFATEKIQGQFCLPENRTDRNTYHMNPVPQYQNQRLYKHRKQSNIFYEINLF